MNKTRQMRQGKILNMSFTALVFVHFFAAISGCKSPAHHSQIIDSLTAAKESTYIPTNPLNPRDSLPNSLWTTLPGPCFDRIYSVMTLAGGSILVGTSHNIVLSKDGGVNWRELLNTRDDVISLKYDRSGNIIALAGRYSCRSYYSSDQGNSWHTVRIDGDSIWSGIVLSEAGSLIVKNKLGSYDHTTDFGKTWSGVSLPEGITGIGRIGFRADRQAIAVTEKQKMLYSNDDGRTWSRTGTEFPREVKDAHILYDGEFFVIALDDRIWKSSNRGGTWRVLPDETVEFLLENLPSGQLYAQSPKRGLMESFDYGNSWSSLGLPYAHVSGVALDRDSLVIAGTLDHGILRRSRSGNGWTQLSSGWSPTDVRCVAFDSGGILYAGTTSGIYRSDDNGLAWKCVSQSLSDIHITQLTVDPDHRLHCINWTGLIMRSSDKGETWNGMNQGGEFKRIRAMCFASDSSGDQYVGCMDEGVMRISVHEDELLSLADRSHRAEQLSFDASTNSFFSVFVDFVPISNELHAGEKRLGTIHRSDDGCRTWKLLLPREKGVECIALDGSGSILIGTDNSGVLRSKDHGSHWSSLGLRGLTINSLVARDSSCLVASTVNRSSVYITTDSGTQWEIIYSIPEHEGAVDFVCIGPGSYLYLGGWHIGLSRSALPLDGLLNSMH